jgi:alkylhydroperoxidase family enzyme
MNKLFQLNPDEIPAAAQQSIEKVRRMFGFTPSVAVLMALAPAALSSYLSNLEAFGATSFSPQEQQLVLLAASIANRSPYSVAVHSTIAAKVGTNPGTVAALRAGTPVPDTRLEALCRFTRLVTIQRGQVSEGEVNAFLTAGFSPQQLVEVLFGVAIKTFAHYLQGIADPPLNEAFKPCQWSPAAG